MFAAVVGQSWADDAHPFSLEINGVDVIGRVRMESIRVEEPGPGTNGSLSFTLEDPTGWRWVAKAWDEVRLIEHAADRPVLFGGFVQSVRTRPWAAVGRTIEVQCVGYGLLLDRRVVVSYNIGFWSDHLYPPLAIVRVLSWFGGRVNATTERTPYDRNAYTSDPEVTVANPDDLTWNAAPDEQPDVDSPATLRQVLDTWAGALTDYAAYGSPWTEGRESIGAMYWVDGYARLHFHGNLNEDIAGAANSNYDGDAEVNIDEVTGTGKARAADLVLESENTDYTNRAYIVGSNAAGTGFVSTGPLSDAVGDLDIIVSDSGSDTESKKRTKARTRMIIRRKLAAAKAATLPTQPDDRRMDVVLESSTTLDIRPGQKMTVKSTPVTRSDTGTVQTWTFRVAGVSITFGSGGWRAYAVELGAQAGSAMRGGAARE